MKRFISACIIVLAFNSLAKAGPLIYLHNYVRNAITDSTVKQNLEIQYWTEFYYHCDPMQPCLEQKAFNSNYDELIADLSPYKNISSTRVEIGGLSSNKQGKRVEFDSYTDGSCSSRQKLDPKIFDKKEIVGLTVTATKINEFKYDLHCEVNS